MKRAAALLAACALLLLAAAVRLPDLTAAQPYINYVDEGNYLHPVVPMLRDSRWDPGWYMYPSLPLIATAAAARLSDPFRRAAHGGRSLADDLAPPSREYDLLSPELLRIARVVNLLVSLALVALAGLLARRMAGPESGARAGWAAALLAALVPALAVRGAVAMVDPFAALCVLAVLFFTDRLRTGRRPGLDALAAGVLTGCAFASKYPAALVGLAPAWVLLRGSRPWRGIRSGKIGLLLLLAAGAAAGAVAAMPGLVLQPGRVWAALQHQSRLYQDMTSVPLWQQAFVRAEWDIAYGHPEVGALFLLLALGGLIAALRDRALSASLQGWALYAAATILLFSVQSFQPFRNLLPLVAPACILVALLWVRLSTRLARHSPFRPLWADIAGGLLLALLYGIPVAGYARERLHLRDSRTQAVDWLAPRLRPDDRVLVVRELQLQPGELARLPGRVELRPWPAVRRSLRRRPVRFLVAGEPFAQGPGCLPPEDRQAILQAFEVRVRFGVSPTPADPSHWRGNEQILYVLERRETVPE